MSVCLAAVQVFRGGDMVVNVSVCLAVVQVFLGGVMVVNVCSECDVSMCLAVVQVFRGGVMGGQHAGRAALSRALQRTGAQVRHGRRIPRPARQLPRENVSPLVIPSPCLPPPNCFG